MLKKYFKSYDIHSINNNKNTICVVRVFIIIEVNNITSSKNEKKNISKKENVLTYCLFR